MRAVPDFILWNVVAPLEIPFESEAWRRSGIWSEIDHVRARDCKRVPSIYSVSASLRSPLTAPVPSARKTPVVVLLD